MWVWQLEEGPQEINQTHPPPPPKKKASNLNLSRNLKPTYPHLGDILRDETRISEVTEADALDGSQRVLLQRRGGDPK